MVGAMALFAATSPARTEPAVNDPPLRQVEFWAGAEASRHAFAVYSGTVWSPFGSVRSEGLRFRVGGGWGRYSYSSGADRINGETSFADILAGYQFSFANVTIKAYAGAAADQHALTPQDPDNALAGAAVGGKAILETWIDLTPRVWTAIDLAWTSANASYAGRGRLGWRATPALSLGLDAAAFGNVESDGGRAAGFIRYEWADGEVSASAGATGALRSPDTPYAAVNVTMRF